MNEANILSSILETPVKPESSFKVSPVEQNAYDNFDKVFQVRANSHQDQTHPAPSQSYEKRERALKEDSGVQAPVSRDGRTPPSSIEDRYNKPRAINTDSEPRSLIQPESKEKVNPFALPLERLERDLNSTQVLDDLTKRQGLTPEGPPAIDTLRELLTGLNIDAETINQLVAALNNGDAAQAQSILNALRGLLQTSNQGVPAPGSDIVAELTTNRLSLAEQQALLVRAGLTQEEAQQVIQHLRTGNTAPPGSDNSTSLAKTVIDAFASKLNSENSAGSGNLQNGDSSGSSRNSAEGPRNLTGLAAERLETLASLVAPDKTGNTQTNPLISKLSTSPLLNPNASGQPAQSILAEGAQVPAAVADAAAKGAEFVKPAITETYNGRASMDKPITAQIIEKFTMRGFGNHREVHIKLDPPSLGTIRMNVSTSGETVRATIIAENSVVKTVIENNLSQLKDSITNQGVKIDSFNVLVGGNAGHSAEGHKSTLDYLGQLGREGSMAPEQAEETVTLHRPVFLNENQSFSIFA
jgi:flagellar hook-length control protein FliK